MIFQSSASVTDRKLITSGVSGQKANQRAEFSQGKAADAGGLPPVKDNNDAMRKFRPGYDLISGRMDH